MPPGIVRNYTPFSPSCQGKALQRRKALQMECFSCEVETYAPRRGEIATAAIAAVVAVMISRMWARCTHSVSLLCRSYPLICLLDLVQQLLAKLQYFPCTQYIACVILYFIYKNHHSPNAFVLAPRVVLVAKS